MTPDSCSTAHDAGAALVLLAGGFTGVVMGIWLGVIVGSVWMMTHAHDERRIRSLDKATR